MGVYLCIGESIHKMNISDAIPIEKYGSFANIQKHLLEHETAFVFLASGTHKIKKKAEQVACENIIKYLK